MAKMFSAAEAYGGCEDDDSDSEHSLNAETAGNLQQMMDSQVKVNWKG